MCGFVVEFIFEINLKKNYITIVLKYKGVRGRRDSTTLYRGGRKVLSQRVVELNVAGHAMFFNVTWHACFC